MLFDPKRCGARIRALREHAQISQSELANVLHITNAHLNRMEAGTRGVSLDLLLEVSAQFHVSQDLLVTGRDAGRVSREIKAELRRIIEDLTDLERKIRFD